MKFLLAMVKTTKLTGEFESLGVSDASYLQMVVSSISMQNALSKSAFKKLQVQQEKEKRKMETAMRVAGEQTSFPVIFVAFI